MHYFMIEARPEPDNEEAEEVAGAYISCWINFALADGAEVLAKYYIEQAGWVPGKVHEHKWLEKEHYLEDPEYREYLPYYLEAEKDGASFVFDTWMVDAEDEPAAPDPTQQGTR